MNGATDVHGTRSARGRRTWDDEQCDVDRFTVRSTTSSMKEAKAIAGMIHNEVEVFSFEVRKQTLTHTDTQNTTRVRDGNADERERRAALSLSLLFKRVFNIQM